MSSLIEGRTGKWEVVIGLEAHAQVIAKSKLFSGAATAFGARTLQHSITELIPRFKATPRATCEATRLRHCRAGNAQAVTTECAEQRKEG